MIKHTPELSDPNFLEQNHNNDSDNECFKI